MNEELPLAIGHFFHLHKICGMVVMLFSAGVVYPDKILDWVSRWSRCYLSLRNLVVVEIAAIVACASVTWSLHQISERVTWIMPVALIGVVALIRGVHWFVCELIGVNG